jgi:tetratricopeptide (TPR) repeat protein
MFFFKKTEKTIKEYNQENTSIKDKISSSMQKFSQEVSVSVKNTLDDLSLMHKKSKNLLQTNFELGLYHLNNGNIKEAHFRFFIISKFWPKFENGLYYYAYILTLKQQYLKAQNIIEKIFLLNNNPNDEILNLKNKISQYINQQ